MQAGIEIPFPRIWTIVISAQDKGWFQLSGTSEMVGDSDSTLAMQLRRQKPLQKQKAQNHRNPHPRINRI